MQPRETEIFLLPEDEQVILDAILSELPSATVIDNDWESVNRPPSRTRIDGAGRILGIWNRAARPMLSGRVRSNGRVETPDSDYVVEWQRSMLASPGTLQRGRWFTSETVADAPEMADFVRSLWGVLNRLATNRLRRTSAANPQTAERRFRVGPAAYREAMRGRLVLAADALRLAPEAGYEWPLD